MAYRLVYSLLIQCIALACFSQSPENLPLLSIQDLNYEGAFRLPSADFNGTSMNWSEGPIAYNKLNNSIFIVGHAHQQAIAEFAIPNLVVSDVLTDLNMAQNPTQGFVQFLNQTSDGNPEALDRVGGMYHYVANGVEKLIVNAYEYYDAAADNALTTLVVDDPSNLANSTTRGYLKFEGGTEGGAGHAAGWLSPIPQEWQSTIGSDFITGQSSGIPIISRTSVGPSAFAFSMNDLLNTTNTIATETLLDFSLSNRLNDDLDNANGNNDMWTHISRAVFGYIVPGTRTYATFGYSGGHSSGVCYKCTQSDGNLCGGYCAPDATDYYQSYWLWDMNDLIKVKNGEIQPHDVLPYDYGEFVTPFQNGYKQLGGGSFDPETGNMYLTIQRADDGQGIYSNTPVVVVYSTSFGGNGCTVGNPCNDGDVCTSNDVLDANCNCSGTFQDSDNDTVCDANDVCLGGNDNLDADGDGIPDFCDNCNFAVGESCNDGNACTSGDAYNANCNCVGVLIDQNNNGVCDLNEQEVCDPVSDIVTEAGDVIVTDNCHGVILTSPNGTCFRITVLDDGSLKTDLVNCTSN